MPHIIVEFSAGQTNDDPVESMLDALHRSVAETGLFDEGHIRVRAIPVSFYRTAGKREHFIHAQCRIHDGRDVTQKRSLSEAVLATLKEQGWAATVITVEVVELDRASYAKA